MEGKEALTKKERKKEILQRLEKASSENYETKWDEKGIPVSVSKENIEQGKKARKRGGDFELKVRRDLESKGWIVSKWQNNIDLEKKEITPAKRVFNPFRKVMAIGTGFPDFIAFQSVGETTYNVIGVECKINGILSKEEKEKCAFMLNQKIFNNIWISKKIEKGGIEYINFKEKSLDKINAGRSSSYKQTKENSQKI
jgi:tRNA G46 methylase TrmB